MATANAMVTVNFLTAVGSATRHEILTAIASHYGISTHEAYMEVIDSEAEHLLDYLTGPIRTATSLLMKRHGFAA